MKSFKRGLWRWQLHRCLQRVAAVHRDNLVLPDGLDGWVHIAWTLLRPEGLYVLEVLEGEGQLIAGDMLPEWSLVGKRRRFVFPSPLPELERKLAAVRLIAGNVPIAGFLVMHDGLKLARSHPRAVVSLAELSERLSPLGPGSAVRPDYAQSWQRLLAASRPTQ
ncbi:MAG: hypothetical protein ACRER1_00160 [Gammaproteobacteria bacterium]